MARFIYAYMREVSDEHGAQIYISPNYYLDVPTCETVNCAGGEAGMRCQETAIVQDVDSYEKVLEYRYACPNGHQFHIIYHK